MVVIEATRILEMEASRIHPCILLLVLVVLISEAMCQSYRFMEVHMESTTTVLGTFFCFERSFRLGR